ncbi:ABC transporter permease [Halostella litorea]|uniref:ABC transporter permease n=1 Tax=Halostella litorea TaxID=2528831 RepID=UPI0010932F79|nr:ABC transporter permease [Halostella litorea]
MPSEPTTSTIPQSSPAPSPTADAGGWLRQARAFTERYLRVLVRNRIVLFWAVGFPVAFYLLTVELFLDMGGAPADVVAATKAVTAVSYGVFGAVVVCLSAFATHLVEDMDAGRYGQFRSLPLSPSADLCGRLLAGYLLALLSLGSVLAVGVVTGAAFTLRSALSVPLVLAVFAGFAVTWMTLAVAVAVVVTDENYANIVAVSVAVVSYFVTGYNGTQVAMFAGDPALLNALPNTLAARVICYHLVDVADWSQAGLAPPAMPSGPGALAVLAGYGAVALLAGVAIVRAVVYDRGVVA